MATNLTKTQKAWVKIIIGLMKLFVGGWVLMLLIGVVHHEWLPTLPTLGYWTSTLVFYLTRWVVGCTRETRLDDDR